MAVTTMRVLSLLVACMVVMAPHAAAITCGQVVSSVAPCIGYLNNGGPVPPACCSGLQRLNNLAKATPDRQAACGCLKNILKANPSFKLSNVQSVPGKCGINIPYKISPDIDCSTVH